MYVKNRHLRSILLRASLIRNLKSFEVDKIHVEKFISPAACRRSQACFYYCRKFPFTSFEKQTERNGKYFLRNSTTHWPNNKSLSPNLSADVTTRRGCIYALWLWNHLPYSDSLFVVPLRKRTCGLILPSGSFFTYWRLISFTLWFDCFQVAQHNANKKWHYPKLKYIRAILTAFRFESE